MGAKAQATRTWVSGVGDDANPCSRTAPGKTFAGAISKTAAGGEINCIDPGSYGAVTITKSITIDGVGGQAAILASGTNGVVINVPGGGGVVTLRNLSINGNATGLNGIRILQAAEVNIENCVIFEFSQKGIDIAPSANCRVNIKNTIIRGCGTAAVQSTPGAGADAFVVIKDCNLNASTVGFRADARTKGIVDDCQLCGNTNQGLIVASSSGGSDIQVNNCLISDNGVAGVFASGAAAMIRLSLSSITLNETGLAKAGGGKVYSSGNNRVFANTTNGTPTGISALK